MKIAIFSPYNIFLPGGVQEHVDNQARILSNRGHEVTIYTPKPNKRAKKKPKNVIFLGSSARLNLPSATSSDISMTIDNKSIDVMLSKKFDVIHVHEPMVPIAARQIFLRAKKTNTLRVGTFHAAVPGNLIGKSLVSIPKTYLKTILPTIDVFTAVSPAAVDMIGPNTKKKVKYIPNGFNPESYKARDMKRDKNMILFIGRLEKRKGTIQLLKAFEELKAKKPKSKLKIAGDGPLKNSLIQYVENRNINDVEFLGFISDKKKLSLLSKCGVYTSPALYGESFGIVLVEAMAMQAPIVAHPNDGYKWVMQDTGRLSLVDCNDPKGYAERLQLMLEDDQLRTAWQDWAREYVKQFDYEKVVDKYEKLYKRNIK